ncbi:hypothetical protein GOBAR_AA05550 [Gossypium barbadense]|uniref:Membrane-associated kinase regulator 4 n=1 Tax=Gossypium barbadense TaxID=3634 RepID=A0A2P5YHI8_GOSBA|nr:hypothetical protein GOBAR_AA05550 [Gossypium barbadense]
MATSQATFNHDADEEYIDMEGSSPSRFLCYSINSPPQSREFEFQMCSVDCNGDITSTTSPADELFYKGKLLPLHLPPRLQMVQKLLQSSNSSSLESKTEAPFEENGQLHFIGSTIASSNGSSLLESCRVSSELNPDDYFFEWSTEMNGFTGNNSNKSWSKKLKQMKQSSITQKLKASREYLKSLFSKSACSDESCAKADVSKTKECANKYMKMGKKNPFGKVDKGRYKIFMKTIDRELGEDVTDIHRRSFSGLLKRSNSANSEIENSIEGAIAHCKQSQKLGVCSLSASKISVCGDQERPELCSI